MSPSSKLRMTSSFFIWFTHMSYRYFGYFMLFLHEAALNPLLVSPPRGRAFGLGRHAGHFELLPKARKGKVNVAQPCKNHMGCLEHGETWWWKPCNLMAILRWRQSCSSLIRLCGRAYFPATSFSGNLLLRVHVSVRWHIKKKSRPRLNIRSTF